MSSVSMSLIVMAISLAAFAATMIGGLFAMALRDRLHLVLGFSAGAVIGVAFFDLLPEALATGHVWGSRAILCMSAAGFFLYMLIDRWVLLHDHATPGRRSLRRGWIGAGSFSAHSVLDGFAIGIAFQVDRSVGLIVAVAVLVHDFSDGLNTVNIIIRNGGPRRAALRWLLLDAIAPILGAAVSLAVALPEADLALILAIFSGFFLYIGASDLLPESYSAHPRLFTTVATLLGAATLLFVTQIA